MALNKLQVLFGTLVIIYVISPIIFKHSTFIQRSLLFMNYVNLQYNFNLSHPEQLGLKCTRTMRLENNLDNLGQVVGSTGNTIIELGAWHILPESKLPSCITTHDDNRTFIEDKLAFSDTRPIVLYVHGNGGNRGGDHRSRLYRKLAYDFDYHIITFDYRGYGDSTFVEPTTDGLTSDADFIYRWLLKQNNVLKNRIIVWGHSLGTAVAIRMVANLPDSMQPSRLILEAPLDSLANAIANHPFSAPFRIIPYFEYFFVEPIEKSAELNFDSISRIGDIKSTKIMIMHAEDDAILPLKLGLNLYNKAKQELGEKAVKFIQISADHGLGHKLICIHEETMSKVRKFIDEP